MGTARAHEASGPGPSGRIGPYRLITRLDPPHSPAALPCRRFVARGAEGETVLLSAALPGRDPRGFAAEAEGARRLPAPWFEPVGRVSGPDARQAWYASPFRPALPLPVALAVHGGPLPEATVRAVGAALAEGLAAAHAQGLTHAGISPAAVLLTADGPRLGCHGAVRAAGPDGVPRAGIPGLDPGALAPEQAAGGRPRPPGDVFALGAVLAYAATGHTVPESSELPPSLRPVVLSCLTRDPAHRPTAAALLPALAPPAPHATVLNAASSLLAPGWLPGRVVAALARQSAELLAAETAVETAGTAAGTAGARARTEPPASAGPAGPVRPADAHRSAAFPTAPASPTAPVFPTAPASPASPASPTVPASPGAPLSPGTPGTPVPPGPPGSPTVPAARPNDPRRT
ncbi:protein kinase family protein [Streptomyces omiyaensis]|uniref:serine/threonine protein kinase n=1 Tax=Streptomyces omiyaensis TaxID=68247 RepID=UPI0036FDDEFB